MNSGAAMPSVAAQWRSVRRLYPIYSAIAERFELGKPPYADLDQSGGASEEEIIARVQQWLTEVDAQLQPHQFRQMLQDSGIADSEDKLHALVRRYLQKPDRTEFDRDKLGFLLTQYLSACAPPSFQARELSLEEVAQVLEPVAGVCDLTLPLWLEPLEELIRQTAECATLEQLEARRIVQCGRELREAAEDNFYTQIGLIAFTRFSLLLRFTYARVFAAEAQAIEQGLQELEARAIGTVDASEAGLAADEPLETIRELLNTTLTASGPAYATNATSKRLQSLRAAVEMSVLRAKSMDANEARIERLECELDEVRRQLNDLRGLWQQLCELYTGEPPAPKSPPLPVAVPPQEPEPFDLVVSGPEPAASSPQVPAPAGPVPEPAVAPAETVAPPPPPQEIDFSAEIEERLEKIRKSLRLAGPKATGVLRIRSGTLLLHEGEVQMLQSDRDPSDSVRNTVEEVVGTRVLLVERCEMSKMGPIHDFAPLIKKGRDLLVELQRIGAMHGPRHNVVVAATRQLQSVLQQAEKAARAVRSETA